MRVSQLERQEELVVSTAVLNAVRSVVVVDKDQSSQEALARAVEGAGISRVRCAENACDAFELLDEEVDVVFLEIGKDDGCRNLVLERCFSLDRPPVVVAMSDVAERASVFAAARGGAHLFFEKPLSCAAVQLALESAASDARLSKNLVRSLFGRMSLREAQRVLRELMFEDAWSAARGNRRRAARRLGVSRRAIQLMVAQIGV